MNREHLEAYSKAFGMTLAGLGVGWMASRTYSVPDTLLRRFIQDVVAGWFAFPVGNPPELMLSSFLGFVAVTLTFFSLDWRKQVPGILLAIFFVFMAGTLSASGLWIQNLSPSIWNLLAGVVGGGFAFLIQYRDLTRQLSSEGETQFEFRKAIGILPVVFGSMVLVVWAQSIASPNVESFPIVDTASTFGFIWLMIGLVRYDQTVRVMPFGIAGTGKTVAWYKMYRALVENHEGEISTSDKLDEFDENMDEIEEGVSLEEYIPRTNEYDRIRFGVPIGDLIPLKAHLDLPDMAGEWADDIAAMLDDWNLIFRLWVYFVLLKAFFRRELETQEGKLLIAHWLRNAEIVTLFIDAEKISNGQSTGMETLKTVADCLNERNVHLIPVASKADAKTDLFTRPEELRGTSEIDILRNPDDEDFEAVADQIEDWITKKTNNGRPVIDRCDEKQVYPTGIWMKEIETNVKRPDLDEYNRLQGFGFEQLAERIIEVVENRVRL